MATKITENLILPEADALLKISDFNTSGVSSVELLNVFDNTSDSYLLIITHGKMSIDRSNMKIDVSDDGGATWSDAVTNMDFASWFTDSTLATPNHGAGNNNNNLMSIPLIDIALGQEGGTSQIWLKIPNSTTRNSLAFSTHLENDGGTSLGQVGVFGNSKPSTGTALNSMRIVDNGGGTFTLLKGTLYKLVK